MVRSALLVQTQAGLYCPAGDFHIDPVRAVSRALITHAHSDHARAGHGAVLATRETLAMMALRLGDNFTRQRQAIGYGESLAQGGVRVSFHQAGHVLGSAQILVEHAGFRVVVSGDYKRGHDPTCAAFEPVRCNVFITEATFGLPVFRHPAAEREVRRLLQSVELFPRRTHLVGAYALGKAQRIIALLRACGYDRPVYVHGAVEKMTAFYAREGVRLGEIRPVLQQDGAALAGEIVVCPPGSPGNPWSAQFAEPVGVFASGWMRTGARARQQGVELPLVISDHADWDGLCKTIEETQCEEVRVTHGRESALVHWASSRGLRAGPLHRAGPGDADKENVAPGAGA